MKKTICFSGILFFCVICFLLLLPQQAQAETFAMELVVSPQQGADAAAEIQSVLNSANPDESAGVLLSKDARLKVTITPGSYTLSRPLTIYSNTYLDCTDVSLSKLDNSFSYMLYSARSGKPRYSDIENVTVQGGTWDAKSYEVPGLGTGGSQFYFVHGNNLQFRDVTCLNNFGGHMIELGAVKDVLITGCEFNGYTFNAKGTEKEAVQLDVAAYNANPTAAGDYILPGAEPYDDTACENITITNNRFLNYSRGIGTHSCVKGVYFNNITITKNYFSELHDEAVYAFNYTNMTVADNVIDNASVGVLLRSQATSATARNLYAPGPNTKPTVLKNNNYHAVIQGNTITTTNYSLITTPVQFGIWVYGTEDIPISGCTISGNKLKSASSGIYIRYVSGSRIQSNFLYRLNSTDAKVLTPDGIKLLYSKSNTISGNKVFYYNKNPFANGIAMREASTSNTVSGNVIYRVKNDGILVSGSSSHVSSSAVITRNAIASAMEDGIRVIYSCTATIVGNTITGSGDCGISIKERSWGRLISKNNVSANKNYGLFIKNCPSYYCTVSGNIFKNNGKNGVTIIAGYAAVTGNTVTYNANSGITLLSSSRATAISGNQVSFNRENGISMMQTAVVTGIVGNTVSSNAKNGMSLSGGSTISTISGNVIVFSKKNGMTLSSCKITKLTGNKISGSGQHGISMIGSSPSKSVCGTMSGNTFYGNGGKGLYLSKSTVRTLTGNSILHNTTHGISASQSVIKNFSSNTLYNPRAKWTMIISKCTTSAVSMRTIVVGRVSRSSKKVIGTCSNTWRVYMTLSGKKYKAEKKASRFLIRIPKQKKGTVITVRIKDKNKNQTYATTTVS